MAEPKFEISSVKNKTAINTIINEKEKINSSEEAGDNFSGVTIGSAGRLERHKCYYISPKLMPIIEKYFVKRGFKVEFMTGQVKLTRNDKILILSNENILRYISNG